MPGDFLEWGSDQRLRMLVIRRAGHARVAVIQEDHAAQAQDPAAQRSSETRRSAMSLKPSRKLGSMSPASPRVAQTR